MDVSIIFVNYKTKDLTINAINSVIEKTEGISYEIFVVDNASNDGSIEAIENQFPNINIIKSKILPVNISYVIYEELIEKANKNTLENVDNKALEIAEKKIKNKLSNDETILTKKVLKKVLKNSKIEVDVFISTEENITAYQDITNLNINEQNKE